MNTVIPLDQYARLSVARKNLLIPENKVLALNKSSITGLHPSLPGLQQLYADGQLTIIQGVGAANPDLSHFKSIDIWDTGSDASDSIHTGWLGRYFDQEHTDMADPPAIQLGYGLSKTLQGSTSSAGMTVSDVQFFYDLVLEHYDQAQKTAAGAKLSFIRRIRAESKGYIQKLKEASVQKNLSTMYPDAGVNSLADQLKIAARLIGGGLQTKVYVASYSGFDTHGNQVDSTDTTKGTHAELLSKLSVAISAFQNDLELMGKQDRVIGFAYSEFGRRIKSNASYGCDHGTSAPVFLFGSKLKGGLIGHNPEIATNISVNDNLALQTDFRSVYASLLKGWFKMPEAGINNILLNKYPTIDLFKNVS